MPASNDKTTRATPEPFIMVIFGATGDLTRRKLMPALYALHSGSLLPSRFFVIGFARRRKSERQFREEMRDALKEFSRVPTDAAWDKFSRSIIYHRGDFDDTSAFTALRRRIEQLSRRHNMPPNCLFYLATPPEQFGPVCNALKASGLSRGLRGGWARVIVEKPFGRDLQSARSLNRRLGAAFAEERIFRIDHYLGKETVQNILVFRFGNGIFEPLWNHKYIDHVQISALESIGVERRGRYFDRIGTLRDVVQNHIMHLLTLVAMEPPSGMDATSVRDEKVKVLAALRPVPAECAADSVVRGQYAAGRAGRKRLAPYRQEEGVSPDSCTETFAALKVHVDNWRWAGVPFYLRTGKRLAEQVTDIAIHFKPAPHTLFEMSGAEDRPNVLSLRIQPDEGISLRFQVKVPGTRLAARPFQMDFTYGGAFGMRPPEAYERLLLDALMGDPALFIRNDEVDAAWRFLAPILECSDLCSRPPAMYPAGSRGPAEADALIERDGRRWELLRRARRECAVRECRL